MKTIRKTDVLLPDVEQPEKWAVVSCDQFTSQRDYWEKLKDYVGSSPSALKLIFPEVYLDDPDGDERILNIDAAMESYLESGVFRTVKNSFVLVKRDTEFGMSRLGIVLAVDLEDYSFTHPNNAYIRSTEGVVLDRIPPRLKIRSGAPLELPHIILLIDDRKKRLIESFYEKRDTLETLYDFDLNMDGGHVTGYRLDADEVIDAFNAFEKDIEGLYGEKTNFIFAVGDGNHSLATAQAHWNAVKETLPEDKRASHPARYALCEVENLHCDGIRFEPIHRFLFNADDADFVSFMSERMQGESRLRMFTESMSYEIPLNENAAEAIAEIQSAIEEYAGSHKGVYVDYIHGLEHLTSVANASRGVAIEMPKIAKDELFGYVLKRGNLCKKAFSMGEAEEKRYYLEAKKIV